MKDTINKLEQPQENIASQGAEAQVREGVEAKLESGSNLGKFKNAESLLEAYNMLQSDYTKKCQALSQLQKEADKVLSPAELKNKWEEKAKEFLENNEKARGYQQELIDMILSSSTLSSSQQPFQMAWNKYLEDNFKKPEDLVKDKNFLQNYIFNNEQIKNVILSDYFTQLNSNEMPTLITAQRGSKTFLTPPSRPKSLTEAGRLVTELFE